MSAQWYHGDQGRQQGPVSEEEMRAMIAAGQVGPQTMVWREGLPAWQPLSACPELVAGHPWIAGYGAPVAPTSGLAIASLVCGIVSLFLCYVHAVAAVPAVICGHMAIKRIRESAMPTGGRGLAVGGLVTGYLGVLAQLATLGFIGVFFFTMFKTAGGSGFAVPSPSPVTVSPSPAIPSATPGGGALPGQEAPGQDGEKPAEQDLGAGDFTSPEEDAAEPADGP